MGREKVKAPLSKDTKPLSSYWTYLVVALVAIILIVGGSFVYTNQEQQMRQRVEGGLTAIAQLKVNQIEQWRAERIADANILGRSQFFVEGIAKWLASPDTDTKENVITVLAELDKQYQYQDILLVDLNGKVLLTLNNAVEHLSDMTLAQLAVAFKEHEAVIVDFHYPPDSNSPHLDVVAPLFIQEKDSQQAIGAVVLYIDPSQYLYPLIQSWPIPSNTAETLLVERDGDQVLFLNDLRHQENAALKLRIPLSQQEVPAVMAVTGKEGIFEGKDYRGAEVLSALKHIPDSPWYMVAKIDTDEALGEWHMQRSFMIAFIVLLLAIMLAIGGTFWQRRQRLAFHALHHAEVEHQTLVSHFDYLVKYANDIIILTDENHRITEANDRALETYGYTREEMLGLEIEALVAPEGLAPHQARMQEIAEKGSVIAEAIHKRKNNSLFPVEISGRNIKIENKLYFQAIIRDITERKRAEEELKLRAQLLDDANDSIFLHDFDGNLTYVNEMMCKSHGYSEEELMNVKLPALVIPEYAKLLGHRYQNLIEKGYDTFESAHFHKDGSIIPFEIHSRLIEFEDKKFILTVARDITERKKAEETLRDSEMRYRTLIEDAYDMIQSVRPDGSFIFVNRAWLKTLGYSESDLPGLNIFNIIHPESLEHCQQIFSQVIGGKSVQGISATFVAKDGRRILVNGNATPRFAESAIVATHGIFRDVTEHEQIEEERQQNLEKLQKTVEGAIEAIASMAETRDPYTAGHQRQVSKLASAIAQEMGLPKEKIETIRISGILHDIGKVSVPSEILSKPTKLNQIEIALIRNHPKVSRDILKTMELPWTICPIVVQHHERMDGSGYPNGLSGQDILLEARILAVADVVEAMASHRPYRPALGIDKALEEITQNKGTLYDADAVDACVKLFTEKGFKFE